MNFDPKVFREYDVRGVVGTDLNDEFVRELGRAIDPTKFFCEVSLETRMGCGFGACWGCVVRTKDLKTPYQRVCKEGPVFNLGNIVWE